MLMAPGIYHDVYVHDIPQYETVGQETTTTVLLFLDPSEVGLKKCLSGTTVGSVFSELFRAGEMMRETLDYFGLINPVHHSLYSNFSFSFLWFLFHRLFLCHICRYDIIMYSMRNSRLMTKKESD